MKMKSGLIIAVALFATCLTGMSQTTNATPEGGESAAADAASTEVMPLIVIDDAPLPDAVRNLARQANLNIQFDPKVLAGTVGPDGKPQPPPNVSFRWENVTAMQALQAVLDNNSLQLIQDPKTKISRVTAKDPAALDPLVPRVITLKYYSQPTNLVSIVRSAFTTPRSQVFVDPRTGQLVIMATEKELETIEATLTKLDIAPGQILIEARFIETLKTPKTSKGINWQNTLESHNVRFGNATVEDAPFGNLAGDSTPDPLRVIATTTHGFGPIGFLNSEGLSATLSFFNSDRETETIATPRAVTLENVATELAVVRNVPILEEQQGSNTGGTQQPNTVKPNYEVKVDGITINEVGTKLIVTPRIFGNTNVFLDLKPEISQQGETFQQILGNRVSEGLTFERRRMQTQAMVPSGNTLVLGGLTVDFGDKQNTKVPVFGDLPGIGRAFRSKTKSREDRQILIFVTPTILDPADFVASPEARDFLHQKAVDKGDKGWGPWDNSEPADWTKPR
jgi:type II secretory pathway component GspD/PulD (secretin)